MTKAQHTKLPWEVNTLADPQGRTEVFAGNILILDTKSGTVHRFEGTAGEEEANASFIVKAVNCHDELLNALKEAVKAMRKHDVAEAKAFGVDFVAIIKKAESETLNKG